VRVAWLGDGEGEVRAGWAEEGGKRVSSLERMRRVSR
jgi:hypothetical protein